MGGEGGLEGGIQAPPIALTWRKRWRRSTKREPPDSPGNVWGHWGMGIWGQYSDMGTIWGHGSVAMEMFGALTHTFAGCILLLTAALLPTAQEPFCHHILHRGISMGHPRLHCTRQAGGTLWGRDTLWGRILLWGRALLGLFLVVEGVWGPLWGRAVPWGSPTPPPAP